MLESLCVCDDQWHSDRGGCERRDLRDSLGTLHSQLVFIAGDFHDGFPVALSVDQRRCVNTCTYTAEHKRTFTCK